MGILKLKPYIVYLGDLHISKMTDPKAVSSPFKKLSNQGQIGMVPLDWTMLGTINQGMENSTKVSLGCLTDSPRMVFSMVSIDHLKRVRVKVNVLE